MDLRTETTPGPWTVETIPSDGGGEYITGHVISPLHDYAGNKVSRRDSITDVNSMTCADAYLIAASPNLLESCRELHKIVLDGMTADYDEMVAALGRARQAIELAKVPELRNAA